jgi:hypothetical protein
VPLPPCSPTLDEIEHAAHKFCGQEWAAVNSTNGAPHAFTRDELLPYRCVEVVYIHTLLKHGYGFPGDTRNITFVLDIDGMEVEWTLGYALAEVPLYQIWERSVENATLALWGAAGEGALWETVPLLLAGMVGVLAVAAVMFCWRDWLYHEGPASRSRVDS